MLKRARRTIRTAWGRPFKSREGSWSGEGSWASDWRAPALAALLGCSVVGCGSDGPTEPEAASLPELFGDQLFLADGSPVGVGALANTPLIGIYFASPGCPACGAFNPILRDAYDQMKEDGKPFEVVLVTLGVTESAMFDYMVETGMLWLALSSQGTHANALAHRYDIRWVPTVIIIDGAGNTISVTGREEVTRSGAAAYEAWLAKGG